ncbi:hypothetical protein [Thalassomonas actiniarum]|uniref:Uncharacterized protein n=1 Tax=Thalassomonas actiniarum TaxID=485447 RepID=A0AAE9YSQ7_9GAMM|nr:hypothetical protein [Thalassomonas actiniarum]WDE00396.1 hypothetical protein SG35_007085 [Thalassomonas actiniarum]
MPAIFPGKYRLGKVSARLVASVYDKFFDSNWARGSMIRVLLSSLKGDGEGAEVSLGAEVETLSLLLMLTLMVSPY